MRRSAFFIPIVTINICSICTKQLFHNKQKIIQRHFIFRLHLPLPIDDLHPCQIV